MTQVRSPDLELGARFQVKHYPVFGGQSPGLGGGYEGPGLALYHLATAADRTLLPHLYMRGLNQGSLSTFLL